MKYLGLIALLLSVAVWNVGCDSSSGDIQPDVVKHIPAPTPETVTPNAQPVDPITMHEPPKPDPIAEPKPIATPKIAPAVVPNTAPVTAPNVPKHQVYQSDVDPNRQFSRETVARQGSEEVVPFEPMVLRPSIDILFVIDDSKSMKAHQINLSRNIDKFVKTFTRNNQLDFQIAVTSIYDSKRYFKIADLPKDDERNLQGVTEMSRLEAGKRNFYRMGQLIPIPGDPNKKTLINSETNNLTSTLGNLLKIGWKSFTKKDEFNKDGELVKEAYGPRYEEILYPMMAAVDVKQLIFGNNSDFFRSQYPKSAGWDPASNDWAGFTKAFNSQFPRPNAHLAVIFVTDTFDQSYLLSAQQVKAALVALKADARFEKISTYGVLHPNSLSDRVKRKQGKRFSYGCAADEDVRGVKSLDSPQLLESFLSLTRGNRSEGSNIFNICSRNYGTRLAQVGTELRVKTLRKLEIPLGFIPERDRISVKYAGRPILDSYTNQQKTRPSPYYWKYRSTDKTIVIYNLDKFVASGSTNNIEIDFAIVDPMSATTDSSQRIGK